MWAVKALNMCGAFLSAFFSPIDGRYNRATLGQLALSSSGEGSLRMGLTNKIDKTWMNLIALLH